ncbi:DUF6262 family protein [Nonomuraea angiospora]|uniref:DUF6262 family protein n=1 Tax=Nonomuraea angiospora TaxID=46172 RepID=UPI00344B2C4D
MNSLPDHLRQSAASRTAAAEDKARRALRRLAASREPISFTAVAKAANVSTDFLYRHAELRTQIERQRAKHRSSPRHSATDDEPGSSFSSAVRVLTRKLEEERRARHREVGELRTALEVAQGENLELRRRLEKLSSIPISDLPGVGPGPASTEQDCKTSPTF